MRPTRTSPCCVASPANELKDRKSTKGSYTLCPCFSPCTWPAIRVMQKVVFAGCGPGCLAFAYACRLKGFNRTAGRESGSWLLAPGMQIVCRFELAS